MMIGAHIPIAQDLCSTPLCFREALVAGIGHLDAPPNDWSYDRLATLHVFQRHDWWRWIVPEMREKVQVGAYAGVSRIFAQSVCCTLQPAITKKWVGVAVRVDLRRSLTNPRRDRSVRRTIRTSPICLLQRHN